MRQLDNSTFASKVALRRALLSELSRSPVVLETHGGLGRIYAACYRDAMGTVCEKDGGRAEFLAVQRPTWAVYQGDAAALLTAGAGAHLAVNVLDCDPYGDPWPTISAFFASERPRVPRLIVAVNDGLRQKVKLGSAWQVRSLAAAVAEFGTALYARYVEVCRWLMARHAARAGYRLVRMTGRYVGANSDMTHYGAVLELGDTSGGV